MSQQKIKIDTMHIMRKRVAAICLGDKVDARTHVCLAKHDLTKIKTKEKEEDAQVITRALKETNSICSVRGPHVFYIDTNKKACVTIKLSNAILCFQAKIREATIDYLIKECSTFMSHETATKLKDSRKSIMSRYKRKWIPAATAISDILDIDWQFNYQGLLQAIKTPNFDSGVLEYLTKVLRPVFSTCPKS